MQFTINSFRQLFPDKIFSMTIPWFSLKSPDISPTAVKFSDISRFSIHVVTLHIAAASKKLIKLQPKNKKPKQQLLTYATKPNETKAWFMSRLTSSSQETDPAYSTAHSSRVWHRAENKLSRNMATSACSKCICQMAPLLHCESETPFLFEHNFRKYCLILIILSLLQTEIICPQTRNWICHVTYSLLLHYLENATTCTSLQKLLNKSATHAVI